MMLKNMLKNVMVKNISNLAQMQKDRPGNYRLWKYDIFDVTDFSFFVPYPSSAVSIW